MQLLCQAPIGAGQVTPYIGRPVAAITAEGEIECGIIHCIHDGYLVMKPLEGVPEATVLSLKKSLKNDPRLLKMRKPPEKARIKAWGAYPFGWGFGGYPWGAGLWWIWPLFFLAALAAFPFFFW